MKMGFEFPVIKTETDEEITVSFWHIEEDEEFEKGEDILEVSTDKATYNIPAPCSGKLVEILVQEGGVVCAGNEIAILETE